MAAARQKLPVAANPAVRSAGFGVVAGRIAVVDFDVGHETNAGVAAFDQVVAQDCIFGERASQRAFEGLQIVDPLARKTTFAK